MELVSHIIEVIKETSWPVMLFYAAYISFVLVLAILFIGKGIPTICKWMIGK